jgi:hypothetical protein
MSINVLAAWVAAGILTLLIIFQLLLALGLPLGHLAWGGEHRVLPKKLRVSSAAAIPVLLCAGWIVFARADLLAPGSGTGIVKIMTWVFGAYFALNTLGNLSSKSDLEKKIMTPASLLLVVSFVLVALS